MQSSGKLNLPRQLNYYLLNANKIVNILRCINDIAIGRQNNEESVECFHHDILLVVGKQCIEIVDRGVGFLFIDFDCIWKRGTRIINLFYELVAPGDAE